jgi:hypothetical protein
MGLYTGSEFSTYGNREIRHLKNAEHWNDCGLDYSTPTAPNDVFRNQTEEEALKASAWGRSPLSTPSRDVFVEYDAKFNRTLMTTNTLDASDDVVDCNCECRRHDRNNSEEFWLIGCDPELSKHDKEMFKRAKVYGGSHPIHQFRNENEG